MMKSWRRLVLAAALLLTAGVGSGAAQTVIVANAPPKSAVELVLNLATVAKGAVDANGDASLAIDMKSTLRKQEADVGIYVDTCDSLRRIFLVERGVAPAAAAAGCERSEIPGVFLLKSVTQIVVDAAGERPAVWLKQGPVPKEWLLREAEGGEESVARNWRPAPKGLVLFGGGGLVSVSRAAGRFCGDISDCQSSGMGLAYAAGADIWITRFLAAEVTYIKPSSVTAEGSETNLQFDSELDPRLVTVVGKVGIQAGPARIYGKVGAVYHDAKTIHNETLGERNYILEGVTYTIPGGTQSSEVKTRGWGLTFGGGVEAWVKPWLAIYGEAGRAQLKGDPEGGGEARLDDNATYVLVGLRVHIGG